MWQQQEPPQRGPWHRSASDASGEEVVLAHQHALSFVPLKDRRQHRRCRVSAAVHPSRDSGAADDLTAVGTATGNALHSGSRSRMPEIVSDTVSPGNAGLPVSISYSTQPNAQMSARRSTGFPRACSGLIYAGVPTTMPSCDSPAVSRSGLGLAGSPSPARSRAPSRCLPA